MIELSKQKRLVHIHLCIILGLFVCSTNVMAPIWSHYLESIGGDSRDASIAVATNFSSICISSLFFGYLIKKIKKYRLCVLISYLSFALLSLGYFLVSTPLELFVLQGLLGFSFGLQVPAFNILYGKEAHGKQAPIKWAYNTTSSYIAYGCGALVGGHLIHYRSWTEVFIFISVMSFIAFLTTLFIIDHD